MSAMESLAETKQEVIDLFFINATEGEEMGYQYFELVAPEQHGEKESQTDFKSLLNHLSDQIKLVRKHLTDIRRKKSKLMKEVQKLTSSEEELRKQLDEHIERQKILKSQSSKVEIKTENHTKSETFDLSFQNLTAVDDNSLEDCGISGIEADVGTELLAITAESIDDELQTYEATESTYDDNPSSTQLDESTIDRKFNCNKCQRQFKRSHHLDRHMKVCSGSQTNQVAQTSQSAPGNSAEDDDMSEWQLRPRSSHFCSDCNKSFSTSYTLELHMRLHRRDFRHLCSVCGKAFVDVTNLNKHMEYHIRRHRCHYCGKSFGRLRELEMHQRRHTGERPYMCSYCGKSYPTSSELRYHLAFHNDTKAHVCDVCSKGFHHRQALREHYRTHTAEKPFGCMLCEEKFSNKYHLLKHQISEHSSGDKYVCSECGKSFFTAGNLRGHQKTHSNDRPYKCDQCDKKYKTVYDLVLHKKKKHEIIVTPQMCVEAMAQPIKQ